jgi:hypothetical protein
MCLLSSNSPAVTLCWTHDPISFSALILASATLASARRTSRRGGPCDGVYHRCQPGARFLPQKPRRGRGAGRAGEATVGHRGQTRPRRGQRNASPLVGTPRQSPVASCDMGPRPRPPRCEVGGPLAPGPRGLGTPRAHGARRRHQGGATAGRARGQRRAIPAGACGGHPRESRGGQAAGGPGAGCWRRQGELGQAHAVAARLGGDQAPAARAGFGWRPGEGVTGQGGGQAGGGGGALVDARWCNLRGERLRSARGGRATVGQPGARAQQTDHTPAASAHRTPDERAGDTEPMEQGEPRAPGKQLGALGTASAPVRPGGPRGQGGRGPCSWGAA